MSDEPEDRLLVYLRRLDGKMDRLFDEMASVNQRLIPDDRKVDSRHIVMAALVAAIHVVFWR